jgi:uncharacterized protein YsxB (DUF464 family)
MTRVEIVKDQNNNITSFRVEGHTGFDDIGKDIVCAGVSAITQTTLAGLMQYLEQKPVFKQAKGRLTCNLADGLSEEDNVKAQVILGTMELGLREMEHQYGDFVRLKIRRC